MLSPHACHLNIEGEHLSVPLSTSGTALGKLKTALGGMDPKFDFFLAAKQGQL